MIQFPFRSEVLQVLVAREYLNGVGGADKVRAPILEGSNDYKELFIVDLVVTFGTGVLFREERPGGSTSISSGCDSTPTET